TLGMQGLGALGDISGRHSCGRNCIQEKDDWQGANKNTGVVHVAYRVDWVNKEINESAWTGP
ncbi:MAG: hypothetical protein MUP90_03975, partial [Gammaproteobacteria bacterium]|nr:hypothetical protein [Gammaproteobacteria bacterium]